MGFLSFLLPNFDLSQATSNALLVELMLPRLTKNDEEKCHLAHSVADIYRAGGFRSSTDVQALRNLDEKKRIVQLNFIALALDANQIQPALPGQVWGVINNPFRLGNIPKQKIDSWVAANAGRLAKSHPELTSPQAKSAGITLSIRDEPLCFMDWMIGTPAARLISLAEGYLTIDETHRSSVSSQKRGAP